MLVEFEESGGVFELAAFAFAAFGLDLAERGEGFLELAGEAMALDGEVGDEAVGVDDVEGDACLLSRRVGSAMKQVGFEERDAIEAPGGVGELLDELSFGGRSGLVFVEEAAAMGFVRRRNLRRGGRATRR